MKVSSGSNHNKSGSHHNRNGRSKRTNHDDDAAAATTLQYWKTKMGHHNNSSNTTTMETSRSDIWLTAISRAEHRRRNDARDAAGYLGHLKQLLQRHVGSNDSYNRMSPQWNNPPTFYPPPPRWDRGLVRHIEQRLRVQNDAYGGTQNEDALVDEIASSMMPQLTVSSTPTTRSSTTNQNQYSVFDDDEHDDDEHDDDDSDDEIEGEEIVYNTPRMQHQQQRRGNNNNDSSNNREDTSSYHANESSKNMSMRRILLRIYCSLAEIHSSYALECSRTHPTQWIEGADEFQIAYNILRSGQEIIDEEHALLMQVVETISLLSMDDGNSSSTAAARLELEKVVNERQIGLSNDSQIVSVPLAYFTTSRDKYIAAAQSRIATLEDKLYQDWNTRQEIMNKMGADRWKNNPRPNYSHYEARKRMEKELDDCLEGVNRTRMMDVGVRDSVEMM